MDELELVLQEIAENLDQASFRIHQTQTDDLELR
jgi:hypothetical protein